MKKWQKASRSSVGTYHQVEGKPLYPQRFFSVLPFHEPGLAPVVDKTGAYHINEDGQPAYSHRFLKTFGFYEGKAAVCHKKTIWFHIFSDGNPVYPERYDWCGNYQHSFSTARNHRQEYFHINSNGQRAYSNCWQYAGDFREGSAVVQNSEGLHSHINEKGALIHHQWFLYLDVFHKGFARAKDESGWYHIDQSGNAIYEKRFAQVEPFYNGQARVATFDDALLVIDERGNTLIQLCPSREDGFHELSRDLVGYWKSYTIYTAVELGIFDFLPASIENLAEKIQLPYSSTKRMLRALKELHLLKLCDQSKLFTATEKGEHLKEDIACSLAPATRTWMKTIAPSWETLTQSLKTGESSSKQNWFEQLDQDKAALQIYQNAISSYAEYDYQDITQRINWTNHRILIDAGGGKGVLLKRILSSYSNLKGVLLERAEVARRVEIPNHLENRLTVQAFDLFRDWKIKGDAVILARVLHDWNDEKAVLILNHAYNALENEGTLYIIEFLLTPNQGNGGLLDLNMLVTTGGRERTTDEVKNLLGKSNFQLDKLVNINQAVNLLAAKKI